MSKHKNSTRQRNGHHWLFYIKYFVPVLVVIALLVVGGPILIGCLFKSPAISNSAEWSAADTLSFYGAALGFIGSVVLGAVSVCQNRKLHNELKQQTEESQWHETALAHKPQFCIEKIALSQNVGESYQEDNGTWQVTANLMSLQENENILVFSLRVMNGQYICNCKEHAKLYSEMPKDDAMFAYKAKESIPQQGILKIPFIKSMCQQDGIFYLVFDCEDDLENKYRQIIPMVLHSNDSVLSISIHELLPTRLISKWQGDKK